MFYLENKNPYTKCDSGAIHLETCNWTNSLSAQKHALFKHVVRI